MSARLNLLSNTLELVVAGLILAVIIGVVAGPGDEYSCAPSDSDGEDEANPEDPDLERDYDIAADSGVL